MKSKTNGMSTSISLEAKAEKLKITDRELILSLADGRKLEVPLAWFPKLLEATSRQRNHYRLIGDGIGIHWPDIDEDLSVSGFLAAH